MTRDKHNRQRMGAPGAFAVLRHMARWTTRPDIAAEAASGLLNLCYERPHVAAVLEGGGVLLLVACLRRPHAELQASAAGALQSICFLVQFDCLTLELMGMASCCCLHMSPACRILAAPVRIFMTARCTDFLKRSTLLWAMYCFPREMYQTWRSTWLKANAAGALQSICFLVQSGSLTLGCMKFASYCSLHGSSQPAGGALVASMMLTQHLPGNVQLNGATLPCL